MVVILYVTVPVVRRWHELLVKSFVQAKTLFFVFNPGLYFALSETASFCLVSKNDKVFEGLTSKLQPKRAFYIRGSIRHHKPLTRARYMHDTPLSTTTISVACASVRPAGTAVCNSCPCYPSRCTATGLKTNRNYSAGVYFVVWIEGIQGYPRQTARNWAPYRSLRRNMNISRRRERCAKQGGDQVQPCTPDRTKPALYPNFSPT